MRALGANQSSLCFSPFLIPFARVQGENYEVNHDKSQAPRSVIKKYGRSFGIGFQFWPNKFQTCSSWGLKTIFRLALVHHMRAVLAL